MSTFLPSRFLRSAGVLGALVLALWACTSGPRPVHMGEDTCDHCHMTVSDERVAAQLVTDRGRSHVFDAIECMAEFLEQAGGVAAEEVEGLWVTDFSDPGRWVDVQEAVFLQSEGLQSPMGMNLSAYASTERARDHQAEFGGQLLSWAEVVRLVRESPVRERGHSHGR